MVELIDDSAEESLDNALLTELEASASPVLDKAELTEDRILDLLDSAELRLELAYEEASEEMVEE